MTNDWRGRKSEIQRKVYGVYESLLSARGNADDPDVGELRGLFNSIEDADEQRAEEILREVMQRYPTVAAPASDDSAGAKKGREYVARAVPLLREYTEKFRQMTAEANRLRTAVQTTTDSGHHRTPSRDAQRSLLALARYHDTVSRPARALAQNVSQWLEHGQLDEFDRIETKLRLAEFEAAMQLAFETVSGS